MQILDQDIRQKALNPNNSFIVQAPAGSGKTEILSQRYLVLLSHAQKAPEEIVAITFTRKAAAEMRTRIINALLFAKENEPDKNDYRHVTWSLAQTVLKKDAALGWGLLHNPNRLRILTIDALSAFLCRQTPILTQIGSSPDVCENADTLYLLAAQRLLSDLASDKQWQPTLEHILLHVDNHVGKLEKLLTGLLANRDQWLPHIMYCYQKNTHLRTALENSLHNIVLEKLQLAAKNIPSHLKQTIQMMARHAGDYFKDNQIIHPIAACADFVFQENPGICAFAQWFGLAHLFLTTKQQLRKTVTIKNGFSSDDNHKKIMLPLLAELSAEKNFISALADIALCPPITYTDKQWETLMALTQLLPLLSAQLTLVFQEKKQVDFVELNLAALRALGDEESPTDLALYLDYQIRHLLIDEFQDTSVTQLHLLEKMTAEWQPNDGRTLFLVGDPMQSIYRFRNAEVGLFMRVQEQGIGHLSLEPLTLLMNFRSQQHIVDWCNTAFEKIFPDVADISLGRVPYTSAVAAKPKTQDGVHFYPIFSDQKELEANVLVEKIRGIQQKNPDDSIAILVRSRSHLTEIINALRQFALPFLAVDIESLVDRREILDLLSLTRALLHRADRIAWFAVLRAPWCGLLLNDLTLLGANDAVTVWEAINHTHELPLSSDAIKRIDRIRTIFANAFLTQHALSLSQWIEGVWLALGGPACLPDETSLHTVRAFFNLMESLESESVLFSVDRLIEKCEKLYANADHAQNPIQLMTIHKSKGLEFDHVFLPGLDHSSPPNEAALFRWCDRPNAFGGDDLILAPMKSSFDKTDPIYTYLNMLENQKQSYEMTRVLYVAATRAKKSLHLFARVPSENKDDNPAKKNSFLEKLWPVCEGMMPARPRAVDEPPLIETEIAPQLLTRLRADWSLPDINQPLPLIPNTFTLTKSVTINIDLPSQASRIIGTMIHSVLQDMAQTQIFYSHNAYPIEQWESQLYALGLLPSEMPHAIEMIIKAVTTMLADKRGQWILKEHGEARCEWPLTVCQDADYQHCIIDRSFVDENNMRWIIDYKTGMPEEDKILAYRKQLDNYADIIAHFEKRPIQCGLYFPLSAQWVSWPFNVERTH